jgi:LacI family transcriptional regulator
MKRALRIAVLIETSHAYGRGLCCGIAKYAYEHGPWTFFFVEGGLRGQVPDWLLKWDGDGIVTGFEGNDDESVSRQLHSLGIPTVYVLGNLKLSGVPTFDTDHQAVAHLAADFFVEAGFRHFAFCGQPGVFFSDKRGKAFQEYLKLRGKSCFVYEPPSEITTSNGIANDQPQNFFYEAAMAEWLKNLPKPIGVLACNDVRGQQVLAACLEHKISCPEQVAVMGVDNDDVVCKLANPPLTSIEPDLVRLGYKAAERLKELIQGKTWTKNESDHYIAPKGIVERQSTDIVAVDDPVVARALRLVRRDVGKGMNVKTVLKEVGLSRSTLDQRFAQHVGRSVKLEIQRARLQRVENLLCDTNLSLEGIAARTGFRTAPHLANFFRRVKGFTPGQFRASKQILNGKKENMTFKINTLKKAPASNVDDFNLTAPNGTMSNVT